MRLPHITCSPGRLAVVVPAVANCGPECLIAIQFVPKRKLQSGKNLAMQDIEPSSWTLRGLRLYKESEGIGN